MYHSVAAQVLRLKAGELPDPGFIEVMEHVKEETHYLGTIAEEIGDRWVNKELYIANFYADKAIDRARQIIRAQTINTTATPDTMERLAKYALDYSERVLALLEIEEGK